MVVSVVQTGVVVENIDAAEVGLDAREQLAHLILIGEIGLPCMRADAVLASVDSDHRGNPRSSADGRRAGQGRWPRR
jgi:hypothetical protein